MLTSTCRYSALTTTVRNKHPFSHCSACMYCTYDVHIQCTHRRSIQCTCTCDPTIHACTCTCKSTVTVLLNFIHVLCMNIICFGYGVLLIFYSHSTFQGDLSFRNETRGYFCNNTSYYNDMATLVFNSQETAIKQLFHQSGKQPSHVT